MFFTTEYPDEQSEVLSTHLRKVLGARLAGEVTYGSTLGWRLDRGEGLREDIFSGRLEGVPQVAHTLNLRVPIAPAADATRGAATARELRVDVAVSPNAAEGMVCELVYTAPLAGALRGPAQLVLPRRLFDGAPEATAPLNADAALLTAARDALRAEWSHRGVTLRGPAGLAAYHDGARWVLAARTLPHTRWLGMRTDLGAAEFVALWDALERRVRG